MLQPGGVVVVLDNLHRVGEAEGDGQLHLVLRLVLPVPALPLGLPKHRLGQGIFPSQFSDIVQDAVVIAGSRWSRTSPPVWLRKRKVTPELTTAWRFITSR